MPFNSPKKVHVDVVLLKDYTSGTANLAATVQLGRKDGWKNIGSGVGREVSVLSMSLEGVLKYKGIRCVMRVFSPTWAAYHGVLVALYPNILCYQLPHPRLLSSLYHSLLWLYSLHLPSSGNTRERTQIQSKLKFLSLRSPARNLAGARLSNGALAEVPILYVANSAVRFAQTLLAIPTGYQE